MANLPLKTRRLLARGVSRRAVPALTRRLFYGIGNRATLTTALAGSNNDFMVFARALGTPGNSVRVRIVVSGASTPLSVTASGNDITINSATNGSSQAISTAQQVVDAINNSLTASPLVWARVAEGNDGTGVVAALAFTNLTGGTVTPNP
jgi:hypothetical protein